MKRQLALILGVALVIVASIGVGGAAQALWSANATVAAKATSGSVSLTESGLEKAGGQYSSAATSFGPTAVTFKNTGTLPLSNFTTALAQSGTGSLPASITLVIWDNGTTTSCPSSAPNGATKSTESWAGPITWPALSSLAAGASRVFCLTSSMTPSNVSSAGGTAVTTALTVTGSDNGWSASAAGTVSQSVAADPSTVTSGQIGGANPSNVTFSAAGVQSGWGDWPTHANSDIDNTSGTIKNQDYFCVGFTVTSTTAAAATWSFQIDTSVPPYNGVALTDSMVTTGNAKVSAVSGKPTLFTITGTQPIKAPNTADVQLCLDPGDNAPVLAAGSGTYTVGTPVVAACPAAKDYSSALAAMGTRPPTTGSVCLYLKIDGHYPHFWVGYTTSVNWTSVLNSASSLTQAERNTLATKTSSDWEAYGSDGMSSGVTPTHVQNGDGSYTITWTENGLRLPVAITNGTSVVLVSTFSY